MNISDKHFTSTEFLLDNLTLLPENVDFSDVTQKWMYDYDKQQNDKVFEWLFPILRESISKPEIVTISEKEIAVIIS